MSDERQRSTTIFIGQYCNQSIISAPIIKALIGRGSKGQFLSVVTEATCNIPVD
ncbi:hypothetical protein [Heliothis virescens ascovirus 3j]|uniref:Uncharacterized protein n=1 Tax=Heliothis virescens ascovirus 3j TaxID=1561067 RepID=A0A2Z5UZG3_9VIRU|nr:hypothetical protein [Heliothis virescens ascovirus 3j]